MNWMTFSKATADGPEEMDVSVAQEANDILTRVMPFGVSLLLHVGVLLVIAFATVALAPADPDESEMLVIPVVPIRDLPGTPVVVVSSTKTVEGPMAMHPVTTQRDLNAAEKLNPGQMADKTGTGLKGGKGGKSGGQTGQSSSIFGVSSAAGEGGENAGLFDGGATGATGMKTTFFGNGGNARKVVYLIDASGTLISTLPFVVAELKRSINELSEKQEFAVIFFQGSDFKEVPAYGMKKATQENRTKVFNWIDGSGRVVPQSGNNPVKAIQQALSYQPQLIFILSDNITGEGIYQVDQRHFLSEVARANTKGTKINTIQFLQRDPLVRYGKRSTLEEISDKSGGVYKFLDSKELGIE